MQIKLIIGGVDFIANGYVSEKGIKQSLEHRSGENAGEMADGSFRLDYLWSRVRLDVNIVKGLNFTQASEIFSLLAPQGRMEFFDVTYTDVLSGQEVTEQMYSNNYNVSVDVCLNGDTYYEAFTIPLIGGIRK